MYFSVLKGINSDFYQMTCSKNQYVLEREINGSHQKKSYNFRVGEKLT